MFTLKQATILALVGSALASPMAHWGRANDQIDRPNGGLALYEGGKVVVFVGNPTKPGTNKTPTGNGEKKSTPQPSPSPSPVTGGGSGNSGTKPTPTPVATTPTTGGSTGGGYLDIANKWRRAGGLSAFIESPQLVNNAAKTAREGNGRMVHQLNSGTMGQVLAPGNANNFESVYVGGWLCERKNLAGLNGICATMEKGWDHSNGETGHADILSASKYTKIGCALAGGIWACDVA